MRQQPIPTSGWNQADPLRHMQRINPPRRPHLGAARLVLARAVEDEVIPRLLESRRPQTPACQPDPAQLDAFTHLILHGTALESAAFVEALRDGGATVESLYLGLLTQAARRIGVMWEEDDCNFSEVTLATIRLRGIVRHLEAAFCVGAAPGTGPAALLAQMPGEQHGLGLAMVVQFFRRAGWTVREAPAPTSGELVDLVRGQWFGVVGLSVSCNDRIELLAADIRAIRRHSRNPAVGVMVGGPPFVAHPQLAAMVGADATAVDARQAVRQAECLLACSR